MKPGDVFWYNFPEPEAGQRVMALPHMVVLVSKQGIHSTVNACPISSARNYAKELRQGQPSVVEIKLSKYRFLSNDSVILADQIFCLTPDKLASASPIGFLDDCDLNELKGAIYDYLELDT